MKKAVLLLAPMMAMFASCDKEEGTTIGEFSVTTECNIEENYNDKKDQNKTVYLNYGTTARLKASKVTGYKLDSIYDVKGDSIFALPVDAPEGEVTRAEEEEGSEFLLVKIYENRHFRFCYSPKEAE